MIVYAYILQQPSVEALKFVDHVKGGYAIKLVKALRKKLDALTKDMKVANKHLESANKAFQKMKAYGKHSNML